MLCHLPFVVPVQFALLVRHAPPSRAPHRLPCLLGNLFIPPAVPAVLFVQVFHSQAGPRAGRPRAPVHLRSSAAEAGKCASRLALIVGMPIDFQCQSISEAALLKQARCVLARGSCQCGVHTAAHCSPRIPFCCCLALQVQGLQLECTQNAACILRGRLLVP